MPLKGFEWPGQPVVCRFNLDSARGNAAVSHDERTPLVSRKLAIVLARKNDPVGLAAWRSSELLASCSQARVICLPGSGAHNHRRVVFPELVYPAPVLSAGKLHWLAGILGGFAF